MQDIVLAGNSLTAEVIYSLVNTDSRFRVVATVVDDEFKNQSRLSNIECVGLSELKSNFPPDKNSIIMAMGYHDLNRARQDMFSRLLAFNYKLEKYIHPEAKVFSEDRIGKGSVIFPGTILEPNSLVQNNTIIWSNVVIGHHSRVSSNCWIGAGSVVAGSASIGENCFLGVNTTVVDKVNVKEKCIIGAGTLISKDTMPNSVYLSRSGEKIRFSSDEYVKFSKL